MQACARRGRAGRVAEPLPWAASNSRVWSARGAFQLCLPSGEGDGGAEPAGRDRPTGQGTSGTGEGQRPAGRVGQGRRQRGGGGGGRGGGLLSPCLSLTGPQEDGWGPGSTAWAGVGRGSWGRASGVRVPVTPRVGAGGDGVRTWEGPGTQGREHTWGAGEKQDRDRGETLTQARYYPGSAPGQLCGVGNVIRTRASVSTSVNWGESPHLLGCCEGVKHPAHGWGPDRGPACPRISGTLEPAPSPTPRTFPPPPAKAHKPLALICPHSVPAGRKRRAPPSRPLHVSPPHPAASINLCTPGGRDSLSPGPFPGWGHPKGGASGGGEQLAWARILLCDVEGPGDSLKGHHPRAAILKNLGPGVARGQKDPGRQSYR